MNVNELLQEIRAEILPGAIGNCQCEHCKRDRKWLAQIDEVLNAETNLHTEAKSDHAPIIGGMVSAQQGLGESEAISELPPPL